MMKAVVLLALTSAAHALTLSSQAESAAWVDQKCFFMTEIGPKYDCNHEKDEQSLVEKYLPEDSQVLELGARYGITSCAISRKQKDSGKLVAVEPDFKVRPANMVNKMTRKCNYHFAVGAISNKPLELHENFIPLGQTTAEKGGAGRPWALRLPTPQLTIDQLQRDHDIKFDAVVADCESCFINFALENKGLFSQLKTVIFEVDYKNGEQTYDEVEKLLKDSGLEPVAEIKDATVATFNHRIYTRPPPKAKSLLEAVVDQGLKMHKEVGDVLKKNADEAGKVVQKFMEEQAKKNAATLAATSFAEVEKKPELKFAEQKTEQQVGKKVRKLTDVETTKFAEVAKTANDTDLVPVKMKDFPVTVMTYNHPKKTDRYVSFVLVKTGQWESESVQALCDAFKTHGGKGNILDVGANIGAFALPLANCVREHAAGKDQGLVAVEASPKNLRNLKAGIKKNNLDNINLYEYAVSTKDSPDTLTFFQSSWNQGKSRVHEGKSSDEEKAFEFKVPATTLDAIRDNDARMKKIFAMKIDIEGYEFYAMQGGSDMFMETPPCIVFAEIAHTLPNAKTAGDWLRSMGYVYKDNGGNIQNAWYEQQDMKKCVARL